MLHRQHALGNGFGLNFLTGGVGNDQFLDGFAHLQHFVNTHSTGVAAAAALIAAVTGVVAARIRPPLGREPGFWELYY